MNKTAKTIGLLTAWALGLAAAEAATPATVADAGLPASATAGGIAGSSWMTPDGRYVAFESDASNISPQAHRERVVEVYLRDRFAGTILRVSVGADLLDPANGNSGAPSVSTNGQWVAFQSWAGNLIATPAAAYTNSQIFLRNTTSHQTTLVTTGYDGSLGNGESRLALISANGEYLAFESSATNLVANDTNGTTDVFVYQVNSGTLSLVSVNASDTGSGNGTSHLVDITPDGRRVLFTSASTNLVSEGTSTNGEVFVRDVAQGITYWASAKAATLLRHSGINHPTLNPAMDASGRYVVYQALGIGSYFHLRADLQGQTLILQSNVTENVMPDGSVINWNYGPCLSAPQISADGRYVAFLAPQFSATGFANQVYIWDATTRKAKLASVSTTGGTNGANASATHPLLSADGSAVAFVSAATNLLATATAGISQIYLRKLTEGTTQLVSENTRLTPSSADDFGLTGISEDGSSVIFESAGDDLIAPDLNRAQDVFVRNTGANTTECSSLRDPDMPCLSPNGYSFLTPQGLSRTGQYLAFSSMANNLVDGDDNQAMDVYWRDMTQHITRLVSVKGESQVSGNAASTLPALSEDGQLVAFASIANDLSSTDPSAYASVYVRDMAASNCVCISSNRLTGADLVVSPWGTLWISSAIQAAGFTSEKFGYVMNFATGDLAKLVPPANGVAFATYNALGVSASGATMVFGGYNQVLLYRPGDTVNQVTTASCSWPAFSANRRWLIGMTGSTGVPVNFIGLWDLEAGTNTLLTVEGSVAHPWISNDGRWIVFDSSTRVEGNKNVQVFRYDRYADTYQLLSTAIAGGAANGDSQYPQISGDGRHVVYESRATDLNVLPRPTGNGIMDVFAYDTATGVTTCLSTNRNSWQAGNGYSGNPILSPDGRWVAFTSFASDLAAGDYNRANNLFTVRLPGILAPQILEFTAGTEGTRIIRWSAQAGVAYRVQYATSLNHPAWVDVPGEVVADGNTASQTEAISAGEEQRFYRIMVLP